MTELAEALGGLLDSVGTAAHAAASQFAKEIDQYINIPMLSDIFYLITGETRK